MLLYIVVGPWVDLVTHWCAVFSQKVVRCAASAARVWSPRYFGKNPAVDLPSCQGYGSDFGLLAAVAAFHADDWPLSC